ncbi:hypothetical protein [Bradyrhizobium sp. STM 3557]|uniref:hypothetical protein n=1 Tax=Bradyrhizobium sp. STM 3557 TaxID=578920 RepID=UPI00388E9658
MDLAHDDLHRLSARPIAAPLCYQIARSLQSLLSGAGQFIYSSLRGAEGDEAIQNFHLAPGLLPPSPFGLWRTRRFARNDGH